jgi:hypothetical protein
MQLTYDFQLILCQLQTIIAPTGIQTLVISLSSPAAASKNLPYTFNPSYYPVQCNPPYTLTVTDTSTTPATVNPTWLTAVSSTNPARIDVPMTTNYSLLGNHQLNVSVVPTVSINTPAPAVVSFLV